MEKMERKKIIASIPASMEEDLIRTTGNDASVGPLR